jgi:hypothetical protein
MKEELQVWQCEEVEEGVAFVQVEWVLAMRERVYIIPRRMTTATKTKMSR